jgi:hypothetical protein
VCRSRVKGGEEREALPSVNPPEGAQEKPLPKKRRRKPGKKAGNAARAKRCNSGGHSGIHGGGTNGGGSGGGGPGSGGGGGTSGDIGGKETPGGGGRQSQTPSPFEALLSVAAQRPTRLAALEARILGGAAAEEALGCTGRIVPLQASPAFSKPGASWRSKC